MNSADPMQLVQNELARAFADARVRRPGYSMRAFARGLGIGHSALSEVLNGKRKLSAKMTAKVVDRLAIDPIRSGQILQAFERKPGSAAGQRAALELNADQFQAISDWRHMAILSLAETEGFKSDPAWIARRLRITKTQAHVAIQRLIRLELMTDRLVPTHRDLTTSENIANASIRKSHATDLELARRSLEEDPVSERYFTSMTMTLDPARMREAQEELRKFRDRFCVKFEMAPRKEVYKLCVQFFPLSKEREET